MFVSLVLGCYKKSNWELLSFNGECVELRTPLNNYYHRLHVNLEYDLRKITESQPELYFAIFNQQGALALEGKLNPIGGSSVKDGYKIRKGVEYEFNSGIIPDHGMLCIKGKTLNLYDKRDFILMRKVDKR